MGGRTYWLIAIGGLTAGVLACLGMYSTPVEAQSPASTGTVMVDGVTVPDIGPLPTVVPIPATNLNYKAKVELGKQLYFDGRLSKNVQVPCAAVITRPPGLPMPVKCQ